jgi:hypothetical protein
MKLICTAAIAATLGCLSALPVHAAAFSDLNDGVVKFTPSASETDLLALDAASISFGNTSIYIGTFQRGNNNQDPIVTSFTNGIRDWTQSYDTSGIDGRGVGLLWDEGSQNLYGVFTADGGSQGDETFGQATQDGWLSGYGSGGGAAVSVLLKLNPTTGTSEAGTFIRALLSNGGTNTLRPTGLNYIDDQVVFFGDSRFAPVGVDGQRFSDDDLASGFDAPFEYRVVLQSDLSQANSAEAIGWNGVTEFSPLTTTAGGGNTDSEGSSDSSTDDGTTGTGGDAESPNDDSGATTGDETAQDDTPGANDGEIVDDIEPGEEAESVPEPGIVVGLLAIVMVGVWRQRSQLASSKAV